MTYISKLEEILDDMSERHGWDWGIKFEIASECAWSAELRITKKPNDSGHELGINPDVSEVYFLAGLLSPEEGAKVFWKKFRSVL